MVSLTHFRFCLLDSLLLYPSLQYFLLHESLAHQRERFSILACCCFSKNVLFTDLAFDLADRSWKRNILCSYFKGNLLIHVIIISDLENRWRPPVFDPIFGLKSL